MNATSVKTRLKNQGKACGKIMEEMLLAYGFERTLYRISVSKYNERFILKGGMFLYALFQGTYARTTRDIDLLAKGISNNADDMMEVFKDIFSIDCDDALIFDIKTLEVKNIVEFKEYHGVNVKITAFLDRTRIPVSIDIGFDDVVYPHKTKMGFPVLLDMGVPEIYAYSLYSVIAEKFEAIVSLGDANSRYKDFYDIYVLADRYRLDGKELKEAIKETFEHRETGFSDIAAFGNDFRNSIIHRNRWKAFTRQKRTNVDIEFSDMLKRLKSLLEPVVDSIRNEHEFQLTWNNEEFRWKNG